MSNDRADKKKKLEDLEKEVGEFARVYGGKKEDILERIVYYMQLAEQGERQLADKHRKIYMIVYKDDLELYEKLRGRQPQSIFFRKLLECYLICKILYENTYGDVEYQMLRDGLRNLIDACTGADEETIKKNLENVKKIKEELYLLAMFLFDWLEENTGIVKMFKK